MWGHICIKEEGYIFPDLKDKLLCLFSADMLCGGLFRWQVISVVADVTRMEDLDRIVATTIEQFGKIDVLVSRDKVLRLIRKITLISSSSRILLIFIPNCHILCSLNS